MLNSFLVYQEIKSKLEQIYPSSEAQSLTKLFLREKLGIFPHEIFLQKSISKPINLDLDIKRLLAYEPIQYVLGKTYFCELAFELNSYTLIPRPETEEMVHYARSIVTEKAVILDIGTGSGCIAVSLAKFISGSKVWAFDISKEALEIAQKNALSHEVEVHFFQMDFLNENLEGRFQEKLDLLISNPPYIPLSERDSILPHVLSYEPHAALFENETLLFYKKIAEIAPKILKNNGICLLECHEKCCENVLQLFDNHFFKDKKIKKDFNGKNRFVELKMR